MNASTLLFGYSIKNGPDRTDLIHAFEYAGYSYPAEPNLFEIVKTTIASDGEESYQEVQTRGIKVTGLKYDGDSEYAFVVEGNIDIYLLGETHIDPLNCKFTACYNTITRKGRANFIVLG